MEQIELIVKEREKFGKGSSKNFRKEGLIPAVVYGGNEKPLHISVRSLDFKKIKAGTSNIIYNLKIEEKKEIPITMAIISDFQTHYLKNNIIHLDFKRISLDKTISVDVAVHHIGKSPAIKAGGILEQHTREIEIECLPDRIPNVIEVDISELKLGESVHVKDIKVSEGIKILTDKKRTLFAIVAPREEVEVSKEEAEEKLKKSLGTEEE